MTERVIVVTPPDDVPLKDGVRILCVDLTSYQTQIVSDALKQLETDDTVITYIWRADNSVDWLLDKKQKSQVILFNAESKNELIVGYMAAQATSYYFGSLRSLNLANDYAVYDNNQLVAILENAVISHKKR